MRKMILAAAVAAAMVAGTSLADETGPQAVPPAVQPFHLGTLQLWALEGGNNVVANDGKVFGVDAGPSAVAEVLKKAAAPTDRLTLSVDALLLREPGRVILFDAGLPHKYHGGIAASLKLAGIDAAEVTDVLVTHPHLDHVGGLVNDDGTPAFPKATVRLSSAAWAWLQKQSAEVAKVIAPQVKTFEPGARLAPGVRSVPLPGHTPGHTGYEIRSGQARLLDVGDMVHSPVVSLARPQWTIGYDNDAAQGRATRLKELPALAKSGELVFAPHFPFPGVGHIRADGGEFRWEPADNLK